MKLSGGSANEPTKQLAVQSVGTWGPFGVANRAGVEKGDLIVAIDGREGFTRESDVFEYVNTEKQPGDQLELTLDRDGKKVMARIQIR